MYERASNSGHRVEWNPDDEAAAEQAMQDVIDAEFEWTDERNRRELDADEARAVRERYDELADDGGDA